MSTGDSEQDKLLQRSRELFDEQVAHQDARTRSRLNQARQAALEAARQQHATGHGLSARWLIPVGSATALALVVVTSVQVMNTNADRPAAELIASSADGNDASNVNDVDILASDADLELLQNMEFYAWLETQSPTGEAISSEAG